ncbi:MAG: response regulator [Acidobacteria bacterium]|nr:response regulator [Acidobacteriota bacterium]
MSAILIVDDEQFILVGLGDYFRSRAYTVDCAQDLEHAMRLLREVKYDLVISDIRLTRFGGEGLRMVQYIKEHSPSTATILLTGAARSADLETEAKASGVDLLLEKPFLLNKLGSAALELLRHRHGSVDKPPDAD